MPKLSSSSFKAALPSAVKNEVVNTVKSVLRKHKRGVCESLPVLRKPVATWNNQNYRIADGGIWFPVMVEGKSKRIFVKADIREYQEDKLTGKFGSLRITKKNGKWIAQIAVEGKKASYGGDIVMGVDLGLKVPAVAVTETGRT
jgi:hypothetical protein